MGQGPYDSLQWKKLLYYENNEIDVYNTNFYVTSFKDFSPQKEWELSLKAIKENTPTGREKKHFACSFPARYSYITKFHPELKKQIKCPELSAWKAAIGFKELYIVYASSYLTNPASMFGHTFLRLSRGQKDVASTLREYTTGFMAVTNPNDDPVSYVVKGITGQYIGFFDVKPFYMNVGLYQNSESRDLWQYKVNLPDNKKDFFINHLWEVSQQTGFRYYFFDENCSYLILRLLEVVMPDWKITDRNYLFAHPIETIKWATKYLTYDHDQYFPGLFKKLQSLLDLMSKEEKTLFKQAKTDIKVIPTINSPLVLDALLEHWKFENYKAKTKLNNHDSSLFRATLVKRASLTKSSKKIVYKENKSQNPLNFHNPNRLRLLAQPKEVEYLWLEWSLGYHNFFEPNNGHDRSSYIDYLGITLHHYNKTTIERVNPVTILSLSPFSFEIPKISWKLDLNYLNSFESFNKKVYRVDTLLGLSSIEKNYSFYFMIGGSLRKEESTANGGPSIEVGAKSQLNELTMATVLNIFLRGSDAIYNNKTNVSYLFSKDISAGIEYEYIKRNKAQELLKVFINTRY